jgi:hypothetical protein
MMDSTQFFAQECGINRQYLDLLLATALSQGRITPIYIWALGTGYSTSKFMP